MLRVLMYRSVSDGLVGETNDLKISSSNEAGSTINHCFLINGGYGKIKGSTFRISNMGNETEESMNELIAALDDVIVDFI